MHKAVSAVSSQNIRIGDWTIPMQPARHPKSLELSSTHAAPARPALAKQVRRNAQRHEKQPFTK